MLWKVGRKRARAWGWKISAILLISRWPSNDGDFRLWDGGFQRCQNDGDSVRMTEGWQVCTTLVTLQCVYSHTHSHTLTQWVCQWQCQCGTGTVAVAVAVALAVACHCQWAEWQCHCYYGTGTGACVQLQTFWYRPSYNTIMLTPPRVEYFTRKSDCVRDPHNLWQVKQNKNIVVGDERDCAKPSVWRVN